MVWHFLLSLSIGVAAVIQSGINKRLMNLWGLTSAVALNTVVLLVTVTVLGIAIFWLPKIIPDLFHFKSSDEPFHWWYVIPGLLGFGIVAGLPVSMAHIGATRAFIIVIAAQLISSLAWDRFAENTTISSWRIVGCALAVIGAGLTLIQR
ncbi:MAG: DMT family transporter [Oligoflexales bacterium]